MSAAHIKLNLKYLMMVASIIFSSSVLAENSTIPQTPTNAAITSQPAQTTIKDMDFTLQICPAPTTLTRGDNLIWKGPNDWISHSESFSTEISHFAGAKWTGINVGKVVCVYLGKGKATFPIVLVREALVPSPEGYSWGNDMGGYKECHANKVNDCPFYVEQPRRNIRNVYEELNFYNDKNSSHPAAPTNPAP